MVVPYCYWYLSKSTVAQPTSHKHDAKQATSIVLYTFQAPLHMVMHVDCSREGIIARLEEEEKKKKENGPKSAIEELQVPGSVDGKKYKSKKQILVIWWFGPF